MKGYITYQLVSTLILVKVMGICSSPEISYLGNVAVSVNISIFKQNFD